VRGNIKPVEFKILVTEPGDFGIVVPTTIIYTQGESINRDAEEIDKEV
jgi:hypothetical protein